MKSTYPFILFICLFALCVKSYGQCPGDCTGQYYYKDSDGDGFGDPNVLLADETLAKADWTDSGCPQSGYEIADNVAYGCIQPPGFVGNSLDFNDSNSCITYISPQNFHLDADGDGFGDPSISVFCSSPPENYVNNSTDCNDNDPSVNKVQTWYLDADGDGVGFLLGQVGGVVGGSASGLLSSSASAFAKGFVGGFIGGFVSGTLGAVINGASIGDALKTGLISGAVAGVLAGLQAATNAPGAAVQASGGTEKGMSDTVSTSDGSRLPGGTSGGGGPSVGVGQVTTPGVMTVAEAGSGEYSPDWWNSFQNQIPEVFSDQSFPSPPPILYSGAATPMGFDSPFFVPSLAAGVFSLAATTAKTSGRVFWSGGNIAKNAAMDFAKTNGLKTLEMTTRGRIMNAAHSYLPRSASRPIWDNLSRNFANGAKGQAHFFTTPAGPRSSSIWLNVEKPVLQRNGVRIITH